MPTGAFTLSSSLLVFFLKVFHHDARSRFEGGDAAFCDVEGICSCGGGTAGAWTLFVAIVKAINRDELFPERS